MSDAVSEVKARLNIEDIVSEYVQLKRAGRNFKGLSPFTNEKTPSFIVSPDKQIWHDFSSGKGGDMISFIEQVEGLDFKGALELLARKAGVELTEFKRSNGSNSKAKERLFDAVEASVSYYQVQLTKNEQALKYLRLKREYDKQTIIDFRFGYSPSGKDNLYQYLKSKGFEDRELLQAGLVVKRDNGIIDMFRGRIMVPLRDTQGRPVAFTARQLKDDKNSPKYINTQATILYDKSRQLFGFSQAKEGIRKSGYVVVVEGNLDVVASHQAGITQVVASAGTALTTYHLKSLQRFTGDVRLAFDDDRAGQEAAERTIPLAQELGLELNFITIPSGKDPDELIKKDPKLWVEVVEKPIYMIDWLIDKVAESVDLTTAAGKRTFTTKLLDIIKGVKDEVEREHYLRIISEKTKTSLESIMKKLDTSVQSNTVRLKKTKIKQEDFRTDELLLIEQHLMAIMSNVADLRPLIEKVPIDAWSEEAKALLNNDSGTTETDYGKMVSLLFEETYQHTERDELEYQARQLVDRLTRKFIHNKKNSILKQLETADEQTEKELLGQVRDLDALKTNITQSLQ